MTTTQNSAALTEAAAKLADQIGLLKAEIAPALAKLSVLEKQLKAFGVGKFAGEYYEANVFTQERDTLDLAAVREKLSAQFIRAHTTTKEVTVLKLTARQMVVA
jgi:hypothetical protein